MATLVDETGGRVDRGAWRILPTIVLRQAGFDFDLLAPLVRPEAVIAADEVLDSPVDVDDRRRIALDALKPVASASARAVATRIGQDRLPRSTDLRRMAAGGATGAVDAVERYLSATKARHTLMTDYRSRYTDEAVASRRAVVELFTAPRLRDVLLLSNDAVRDGYVDWLEQGGDLSSAGARRKLDTFTMYLQRVATKNETHSHFGPFTTGTVHRDQRGVSYTVDGADLPVTFLSHWAAELLARALSDVAELRPAVRPRRRPLAFVRDGLVDLYAFTSDTGYAADWRFVRVGSYNLDNTEEWLLRACDRSATLADLARQWSARGFGDAAAFDRAVRRFEAADILVVRFEIPPGDAYPLDTLLAQLDPSSDGHPEVRDLHELQALLTTFATADFGDRPALLATAREIFVARTGTRPHRGEGRLYADRSIVYEERRSALRNLTLGGDLAGFIETDMAVVYELALAGPRLRMRREAAILADWFSGRYSAEQPVPLDRFYEGFFDDRASLDDRCRAVEEELVQLDTTITDALLSGADPARSEVEIPRDHLTSVLDAYPSEPAAVCNPDVMIAASSAEAIAEGRFLAVVGECHAVRELISHTSFSPLVDAENPGLTAEVCAAYRSLLDVDEVLVDVVRGHPDKTAVQLQYPCPDLELFGRSAKTRGHVIQPADVFLRLHGSRLELRAHAVPGRLRLMAPPAGGPSIIKDPLSIFSFPRHFGGIPLHGRHLVHLPRLRCGRVILQRELWRVPADRFRRTTDGPLADADDFLAMRAMRREYGLPRRVFAKFPGEPKPVFVDWDAPLLVRQCVRMARVVAGPVEFSEMLPDHDELWLDISGCRYTSELRCAVFSGQKRR
jgi:hypothetical protein